MAVADPKSGHSTCSSTCNSIVAGVAALTLIVCSTVATFTLYGAHTGVFQHHNAHLVDRLADASAGIRITITEKKPVGLSAIESDSTWRPGVVYHGVLYPNIQGESQPADKTFDGRLSYIHHGSEFNFTLLNDRGFVTVADDLSRTLKLSRCMTITDIPSLPFSLPLSVKSLAQVLMSARVVDEVGSQVDIECDVAGGDRFVEILVSGEPFAFCSEASKSDASEKLLVLHGADSQIEVEFLSEQSASLALFPPFVSSSEKSQSINQVDVSKCESIKIDGNAGSRSLKKSVGGWLSSAMKRADDAMRVVVRGEPRRALMAEADTCTCSNPKICLFVHGLGRSSKNLSTTDTSYWGDIDTDATCCSSTNFIHLDTRENAWYDDDLTSEFCSTALSVTNGTDAESLENLAVVSHSMGNLIVASALQKGTCSFASSSKWISLSPPMLGSMTATSIVDLWSSLSSSVEDYICGGNDDIVSSTLNTALTKTGLCGSLASVKSLVYSGSNQSTTDLDSRFADVIGVFTANVDSVMCGVSSFGITSTDSLYMIALDLFSGHASTNNDGMLEYTSCRGSLSSDLFSSDWNNGGGYYRAKLNHRDTTFRNGNGLLGESRKPVKWFNCQFD